MKEFAKMSKVNQDRAIMEEFDDLLEMVRRGIIPAIPGEANLGNMVAGLASPEIKQKDKLKRIGMVSRALLAEAQMRCKYKSYPERWENKNAEHRQSGA